MGRNEQAGNLKGENNGRGETYLMIEYFSYITYCKNI